MIDGDKPVMWSRPLVLFQDAPSERKDDRGYAGAGRAASE